MQIKDLIFVKIVIFAYFICEKIYLRWIILIAILVNVMRCPYCSSTDSRVTDSRPDTEDAIIRRRRVCNQCGARFTTVERIQMRDLMVRKNSGKLEPFDREKLRHSIIVACHNRDVETADDTVTSSMVGQMVSDSLLNLDPIAFVRFVSVYRKFSRIADFKKIIDQIPEADDGAQVCHLPKTSLF